MHDWHGEWRYVCVLVWLYLSLISLFSAAETEKMAGCLMVWLDGMGWNCHWVWVWDGCLVGWVMAFWYTPAQMFLLFLLSSSFLCCCLPSSYSLGLWFGVGSCLHKAGRSECLGERSLRHRGGYMENEDEMRWDALLLCVADCIGILHCLRHIFWWSACLPFLLASRVLLRERESERGCLAWAWDWAYIGLWPVTSIDERHQDDAWMK